MGGSPSRDGRLPVSMQDHFDAVINETCGGTFADYIAYLVFPKVRRYNPTPSSSGIDCPPSFVKPWVSKPIPVPPPSIVISCRDLP